MARLRQSLSTYGTRSFSQRVVQNTAEAKKPGGLSTAATFGIAVPTILIGSWVVTSKDPGTRAVIAVQLPLRFARDIICAGLIAAGWSVEVGDVIRMFDQS